MRDRSAFGSDRFLGNEGVALLECHFDPVSRRTIRRIQARAVLGKAGADTVAVLGSAQPAVVSALDQANGNRKARLLGLRDAVRLIDRVRSGASVAWTEGAYGTGWNFYDCRTTLAMAARVQGRIWFGVTECPAYQASPGRAWSVLAPWGLGGKTVRERKLDDWASARSCYDLIPIEVSNFDANSENAPPIPVMDSEFQDQDRARNHGFVPFPYDLLEAIRYLLRFEGGLNHADEYLAERIARVVDRIGLPIFASLEDRPGSQSFGVWVPDLRHAFAGRFVDGATLRRDYPGAVHASRFGLTLGSDTRR